MRKLTTLIALAFAALLLASACGGGGQPSEQGAPAGDRIAFTSCLPESPEDPDDADVICQVYLMNSDGSHLVRLTDEPTCTLRMNTSHPSLSWSPDGAHIAFQANWHVCVVTSDASRLIRLTGELDYGYQFAWSPDGTRIAFTSCLRADPEDLDGYLPATCT